MTKEKLEKANQLQNWIHTINKYLKVSSVGEYYIEPISFLETLRALNVEEEVTNLLTSKLKEYKEEFDSL